MAPRKLICLRKTDFEAFAKRKFTISVSVGALMFRYPFPWPRASLAIRFRDPWSTATGVSTESVFRGGPAGPTDGFRFR